MNSASIIYKFVLNLLLLIFLTVTTITLGQDFYSRNTEKKENNFIAKFSDPYSIIDSIKTYHKNKLSSLQKNSPVTTNGILDSLVIVYSDSFRVVHKYIYDENGNKVKDTEYSIDNGIKKFRRRITYSFDSVSNITSEVYELFKNEEWNFLYKYEWEYSNKNLYTAEEFFNWDNGWKFSHGDYYKYSSKGLLLSMEELTNSGKYKSLVEYEYDILERFISAEFNVWVNGILNRKQQNVYEYDKDGYSKIITRLIWVENILTDRFRESKILRNDLLLEEKKEIWKEDQWINQAKEENKYNDNGMIIESIKIRWDEYSNKWENRRRYSYEYNSNSEQVFYLYESWEPTGFYGPSSWKERSRTTTIFSSNGLEKLETNENRSDTGDWEIESIYEVNYNSDNNLILRRVRSYVSDWFFEYSVEYDSKQNRTYLEELMVRSDTIEYHDKTYLEYDSFNRLISSKFYTENIYGIDYHYSNKKYYYYNKGEELFRDDFIKQNFTLSQNYPNPFNPKTVIAITNKKPAQIRIILYNTLGQKVKTLVDECFREGFHKINLNSTDLSSGTYFYRLEAEGFSQTKKMIILK